MTSLADAMVPVVGVRKTERITRMQNAYRLISRNNSNKNKIGPTLIPRVGPFVVSAF